MDDLTQELGKTKSQLAAWKLRYYVEYFRLDGTKKFVKELQDQHSFKDEETSRLNSYIDNIVEQLSSQDLHRVLRSALISNVSMMIKI